MTLFYPPLWSLSPQGCGHFFGINNVLESFIDRGSCHLWFDSQLDIKRLDCITAAFANSAYDFPIP